MKVIFSFLLLTFFLSNICLAQSQSEIISHADKTIEAFSDKTKPGVSGAIIQDGKVIYVKAQGLANPYSNEVINEQSLYPVEDISKQFTSLAFLKLIEDGMLKLEDPVFKYLPELSKLGEEITIDHVLNHTTGLDDYFYMNLFIGNDPSDIRSNSDALSIIALQNEFSGVPGNYFSNPESDTESLLMAEIIAKVSGMPFPEYVEKNIFKPLGLENAVFIDDVASSIENGIVSFELVENELRNLPIGHSIVGPSGLYISIEDLAKWYSFFSPKNDNVAYKLVKKLDTPVRSNNGGVHFSGWGEMTYGRSHLHAERGIPKYWQFGLVGSFGANLFRYPEQDVTSIALGNNNQYNGAPAMDMLTPLMEDQYIYPSSIDEKLINTVALSVDQLEKWGGLYVDHTNGQTREMKVKNDSLFYIRGENETKLLPLSENRFQALVGSDDVIIFTFGLNTKGRHYDVTSGGSNPSRYEEFDSIEYTVSELSEYQGLYINEDYGQVYRLEVNEMALKAYHVKNGEIVFSPIIKDEFSTDFPFFGAIKFNKENGEVVSFTCNSLGVKNITFKKVARDLKPF